jgi:hypothetical protein
MRFDSRLKKLEARSPQAAAVAAHAARWRELSGEIERHVRWAAAFAQLARSMAPEHVERVARAHAADGVHARTAPPLVQRAADLALALAQGRHHGPYLFPPVIAAVFDHDTDEIIWPHRHACADCGVELPVSTGTRWGVETRRNDAGGTFEVRTAITIGPAREWFVDTGCPLCGGAVAFDAFTRTHGHPPPLAVLDDELLTRVRQEVWDAIDIDALVA